MKRKTWSMLLTLALVVGLTGSAFAGSGSFTVVSDSTLQGKTLRPGNYQAKWDANGEISISGDNGDKFKVEGQVVERSEKAARTSILKTNDDSGSSQVLEVRFAGKKTVLVFGESKVAQKK
ncbi:MAG: hypothetical protein ABIP81_05670 [Terriglobales bacterium]